MILTSEQKNLGNVNFLNALGAVRREFLKGSLEAPRTGPYYFGYGMPPKEPVRAGIVGTGNEGCDAMIRQSSPDYLRFTAYFDIRPTQRKRARAQFEKLYGKTEGAKVKESASWREMLDDKSIEAIVIATPLWTHASLAIEALNAGKHVLCEKLMARNVADAKAMVRVADEKKKTLSVGHQRHYSTLYDNVLAVVKSGVLGDIKHIKALWHRNNTWEYPVDQLNPTSPLVKDPTIPRRKVGDKEYVLNDGWFPAIPEDDQSIDYKAFGYDSLEQLIRWRVYRKTGGGLMAELGSHQLDACSLFLNKVHPVAVSAYGGHQYFKQKYNDGREAHDHVYCTFEMPGDVTLTYTSINTNSIQGYGEIVYGTKGTLAVINERDVFLFREAGPNDDKPAREQAVATKKDASGKWNLEKVAAANLTPDGILADAAVGRASWFVPGGESEPFSNRGYHEELEAFADAIRNPGKKVRCDGRVALADTVMALVANVAMEGRQHERIEFKPAWYEPAELAVPDGAPAGAATPLSARG